MFTENLKILRKAKGFSQEELAIRLNVVRQTISKWEKGLSVPDADLLMHLADILETPVSKLLGETIEVEMQSDSIAEQLSRINEQLAIRNRRSRRIWTIIAAIFISFIVINVLLVAVATVSFRSFTSEPTIEVEAIEIMPIETYQSE